MVDEFYIGDEWDEDELLDDFPCGQMGDGTCMKIGSEECDFECPYRHELDQPKDTPNDP